MDSPSALLATPAMPAPIMMPLWPGRPCMPPGRGCVRSPWIRLAAAACACGLMLIPPGPDTPAGAPPGTPGTAFTPPPPGIPPMTPLVTPPDRLPGSAPGTGAATGVPPPTADVPPPNKPKLDCGAELPVAPVGAVGMPSNPATPFAPANGRAPPATPLKLVGPVAPETPAGLGATPPKVEGAVPPDAPVGPIGGTPGRPAGWAM